MAEGTNPRGGRPLTIRLAAAVLVLTLSGACDQSQSSGSLSNSAPSANASVAGLTTPLSVADMVEDVLPSVVNVRVRSVQTGPFGSQEGEGQGSGVIIDGSGLIITNNHVVSCAVEVDVVLNDGRRFKGRVVGTEPSRDLAVVRIEGSDLDPILIGRSAALRLGDGVIAVGFPLGLGGPTVTQGIVSGQGRSIEPQGGPPLEGLLQTDAAINPGNSGGALVDLDGQLIGINTAAAGAGAAENVGFAIPVDAVESVVEDILSGSRAWLGVQVASVDSAAVAAQLGLAPDVRGAAVVGLLPGPAEDAGITEGDVIVRLEGGEIESADDLTEALAQLSPDDRVTLQIVASQGSRSVEIDLAERPPETDLNRELCG